MYFSSQMDILFLEEDNLKRLNEDFGKFKQLANILNDKALNSKKKNNNYI